MRARLRTEMAKYHSSFLTVQITTSFGFTRSSTISDYVFLCPNTLTKFAHFYISLNVTPRKTGVKLKTNKILPFSTQSSPDAHSSASNHSTTLYRRPRKIPRKVVSWIRKLYHLVQTYTDLHIDRDTCTVRLPQYLPCYWTILACYFSLLGYTADHRAVVHLIPIGFYASVRSLGPDLPQKGTYTTTPQPVDGGIRLSMST